MSFRISARNFSLTYPQTTETFANRIVDFIQGLDNVDYYVIGTERHADGGFHQHVALGFTNKKNVKRADYFDIDGYHPNVQSTKDVPAWVTYCKKDGDFITFGTPPARKRKWSEVFDAKDKEEARALIQEISARDYINNTDRIEYFLDFHFKQSTAGERYVPRYTEFNICGAMQAWVDQRLDSGRPKSLILWGPTRTGKTAWARSIGHHMYFGGMFDLSLWDGTAEYAIFDDITDITKFYHYKQWLGAQEQFTTTDKYRKKCTVKWGKPCILLSNFLPNHWDMDWIRGNCIVVQVHNSLY
jgi:hypothetical protein